MLTILTMQSNSSIILWPLASLAESQPQGHLMLWKIILNVIFKNLLAVNNNRHVSYISTTKTCFLVQSLWNQIKCIYGTWYMCKQSSNHSLNLDFSTCLIKMNWTRYLFKKVYLSFHNSVKKYYSFSHYLKVFPWILCI